MSKHRRGGRPGQAKVIKVGGRTVVMGAAQKPQKSGESVRANGGPVCAICRKPLRRGQPRAKAKSGKDCHESCLTTAKAAGTGKKPAAPKPQWNTAAAEREFARNKEAIESGKTFRGHKPSGWRLGSSPSTSGESRR